MTNGSDNRSRTAKWARWLARGLGSFVAAFWLAVSIGPGVVVPPAWTLEDVIMTGLVTISVLGIFIAWRWEGIGGAVVAICGLAHSTFAYFAAGHSRALAMLISGGPFLLIGGLFLISWSRSKVSGGAF